MALLALPLVGPAAVDPSVPIGRRAAPLDPRTAVEPVPAPGSDRYGVPGDLPVAPEPGPGLLDHAGETGDDGALSTVVGPLPPGPLGIPGNVLVAYRSAADQLAEGRPGCGLDWTLLAAIGRIESGHARGGRVDGRGRTIEPIVGIALDGRPGIAAIADTDGGALDGDTRWDRAVGPMQFIPSTWPAYAADGNGDGVRDPHNVYDAAVAAGRLLCAGGGDLRDPAQRARAVFRYNRSDRYVATVLVWADAYARRSEPVAVPPGDLPRPPGLPEAGLTVPPAVLETDPAGGVRAVLVVPGPVAGAPVGGPLVGPPPVPSTTTTRPPTPPTVASSTTTRPPVTVSTTAAPPATRPTTTTTVTDCPGPTSTSTSTTTTTTLPPTTTTTTVPSTSTTTTTVPSTSTTTTTTTSTTVATTSPTTVPSTTVATPTTVSGPSPDGGTPAGC